MRSRKWRRTLALVCAPLLAFATATLAVPTPASAATTTVINFDDVNNGTLPVDHYASLGVHIADAYVWVGGGTAEYPYYSGTHRIFPNWISNSNITAFTTSFDQGQSEVGGWFAGPSGRDIWITCADGDGTTLGTSGHVTMNGTSYTYVSVTATGIRSCSFTGEGTPEGRLFVMDNLTFVTPGTATVPGVPTDLQATPGDGQVGLTWTAPADGGATITSYTVGYKPTADSSWSTTTSASASKTVTGLTNGTSYDFKVLAHNSVGDGAYSGVVSATPVAAATVPGVPTDLQATPGDGQVGLTWTAPGDGGAAIDQYTVAYQVSGSGSWSTTTSASASKTVTGLTNGTSYDFKVLAHNSVGDGAYSGVVSATPVAAATVPGVPTDLQATAGDGQVGLTWTAPADGGATITGYTVAYKPTATKGNKWLTLASSGTTTSVTGLDNNTEYAFKVLATNAVGDGLYSDPATDTPFAVGAPGTPTDVSGGTPTVVGRTLMVDVTWTNTGPASDRYVVTLYAYRLGSKGEPTYREIEQVSVVGLDRTTCAFTGLSLHKAYAFTVTAGNGAGWSAPSAYSAPVGG
jgi:titin